ncbi:MAG: winged helix-turn-helix domain-containing protein [Eubacteriaceae bacterium]|nr:winged helix-turn-helix domain-containing protein [Eubacteriaceae bacterium]
MEDSILLEDNQELHVTLFSSFSVRLGSYDIVDYLGSSKKKAELLAFLVLNKDKPIQAFDLYDVLWPNDENSNPESSLKTLMSRLRANLDEFGLKTAIVTKKGFYSWNPKIPCNIDVFEFTALADELKGASNLTEQNEQKFKRAIAIYTGDLLPSLALSSWVVSKSMLYHNLYLDILYSYASLLSSNDRLSETVHYCKMGLDIDPNDYRLSLELIGTLIKLGKTREALTQYKKSGAGSNDLGMPPFEEMDSYYKKLIKIDTQASLDIDSILVDLFEEEEGAYICDYAIFKVIYQINMRNMKRLGTSMFLALITIDCQEADLMLVDKVMEILADTLRGSLRRGDTIARYSINQFALLLPTVNHQTGHRVLERIKKDFFQRCASSQISMNFKLRPVGYLL